MSELRHTGQAAYPAQKTAAAHYFLNSTFVLPLQSQFSATLFPFPCFVWCQPEFLLGLGARRNHIWQ